MNDIKGLTGEDKDDIPKSTQSLILFISDGQNEGTLKNQIKQIENFSSDLETFLGISDYQEKPNSFSYNQKTFSVLKKSKKALKLSFLQSYQHLSL